MAIVACGEPSRREQGGGRGAWIGEDEATGSSRQAFGAAPPSLREDARGPEQRRYRLKAIVGIVVGVVIFEDAGARQPLKTKRVRISTSNRDRLLGFDNILAGRRGAS